MREAHAVVQCVERAGVVAVIAPCVLQINLGAVGVELVFGSERIDHIQILTRMRNAVSCRVAHLILARVLLDMFFLKGDTSLDVVCGGLMVDHQLHTAHACLEVVAGVLEVGAHAEVLGCLSLREPVLPLYVVLLTLTGGECRAEERHRGGVAPVACDAHRAEISPEAVLLLTVEIDFERLHVLERAEGSLAALRLESIMVVRDVADDVKAPQLVGPPVEVGLVVEEVWFVLTVGLHRTEEILCRFIAQSVGPREVLTAQSHVSTGTEQ